MTNPTSNFGWQMPTSTDLVTDLPADFEVFGQAVDTSMADLKGGTTGQILSKASNTNMDFTWITNDVGDITAVNVTAPITGGGTSGAVTIGVDAASTAAAGVVQLSDSTSTTSSVLASTPTATKSAYDLANTANTTANAAIAKSTVTTAGDIIYRNATVPTRLGIGTAGQVLTVNSGATAPEWVTPGAASFVGCSVFASAALSTTQSTATILGANSENYDTSGFHDNSTNNSRITIPTGKGGYYKISTYMNAQTAQIAYVLLYKNGSAVALGTDNGQFVGIVSTYGSTGRINGTFDLALAAGDYIQIAVISDAATGNNVTKFVFSAIYLGA